MSFSAKISYETGLGRFGQLRRMLASHWGVEINEAFMGVATQFGGNGYTAGIHFESLSYEERIKHKIQLGRAYSQDEWKAAVGPIKDDDTVNAIVFKISGAGDSFDQLCRFSNQHGFALLEETTNELVDHNTPGASILYSLYQLEGDISQQGG